MRIFILFLIFYFTCILFCGTDETGDQPVIQKSQQDVPVSLKIDERRVLSLERRVWKRSSVFDKPKSLSMFGEEEFRTEIIVPVMNIMGLGLSVFGNLYPTRQLRNDDGTPMNRTELNRFRSQMNVFHSRFSELGSHLTNVIEHARALKAPFQELGKKINIARQIQLGERKMQRN